MHPRKLRSSLQSPYCTLLVITFLLACKSWSQALPELSIVSPPEPPVSSLTFRASVREVDLVLSVTDHKGRFVSKLSSSDFTVLDNNQKQTALTFFQSETSLPLRIALVVDVSASVGQRFDAEQGTIHTFLKTIVRPGDTAALFAFNQHVQMITPVAENWKQIRKRVKKLKPVGETAIYDSISAASDWLRADKGLARRIIILITDGEENASRTTLEQSISSALAAEASIYSVNVETFFFDDDAEKGKRILKQLADRTGGNYFEVGKDDDASGTFSKIRRELRSQYALAYRPTNLTQHAFHHLTVLVRRDLRVRCRTGYYAR